jgi:hypothetical protein
MPYPSRDLENVGSLLKRIDGDLIVSKRRMRKAGAIQMVRQRREAATQNLGFAARPFVLCGLPIRRPGKGILLHERRNGHFLLQVTGHSGYGLPWGQDRLVPIFLATLAVRKQGRTISFRSAAEMLDAFGMQQGGSQYRRLIGAFQRIFGATIFFGTDTQRERALIINQARFNFMSEARIWYARDPQQENLPGDCQNVIVLTEEFYREIQAHPIPMDLEAAKALLSMLPGEGNGAGAAFRQLGTGEPVGQRVVHSATEVPGKAGTMAGSDSDDVAGMPGTCESRRRLVDCSPGGGDPGGERCVCLRLTACSLWRSRYRWLLSIGRCVRD